MLYNESQSRAIAHGNGPALVVAGPGSGKTAVLTARISTLIDNGISPSEILVITFTKAAALGMQRRFEAMCEKGSDVTFATFHSLFFMILRESFGYSANSVITPAVKRTFYRELLFKYGIKTRDMKGLISDIDAEISAVKGSGKDPAAYEPSSVDKDKFCDIYRGMSQKMAAEKKLDFDDMQYICKDRLIAGPDILCKWQERFKFILIDEFQDINPVQYELIKMLAAPRDNVFAVGDDDQSIYGFRGSDPGIMKRFEEDYPKTKIIYLDVNYRCAPEVVEHSGRLISANKNRYEKNIRPGRDIAGEVCFFEFENAAMEAKEISSMIKADMAGGAPLSDMAVLYRTNNEGAAFAKALSAEGVPFTMRTKPHNPYEEDCVKDILTYLKLASSFGRYERGDILRILNRPCRDIPREVVFDKYITKDCLVSALRDDPKGYEGAMTLMKNLELMAKLSPFAAVNFVRHGMDYERFAISEAARKGQEDEDITQKLDLLQEEASMYRSFDRWREDIERFCESFENTPSVSSQDENEGVTLTTLHASKGLEYDTVYLVNAIEGITPYKRAILTAKDSTEKEMALEEERRLFYVGLTRAKRRAVICTAKNFNNHAALPSRFIREMKEK